MARTWYVAYELDGDVFRISELASSQAEADKKVLLWLMRTCQGHEFMILKSRR